METTQDIIEFKKRIAQEEFASTSNIRGQDKIFYMREPGYDAILTGTSTSATAVMREGWGTSPQPRRFGSLISADAALRQKGYKPYPIFDGRGWEENELRHRMAAKDRERQQIVFQPVDVGQVKLTKSREPYIKYASGEVEKIGQQVQQVTVPNIEVPKQPVQMKPKQDIGYSQIISQLGEPGKGFDVITRGYANSIMTPNQYSKFAKEGYSGVMGMEKQLGIFNIGYGEIVGNDKNNKGGGKRGKGKSK